MRLEPRRAGAPMCAHSSGKAARPTGQGFKLETSSAPASVQTGEQEVMLFYPSSKTFRTLCPTGERPQRFHYKYGRDREF